MELVLWCWESLSVRATLTLTVKPPHWEWEGGRRVRVRVGWGGERMEKHAIGIDWCCWIVVSSNRCGAWIWKMWTHRYYHDSFLKWTHSHGPPPPLPSFIYDRLFVAAMHFWIGRSIWNVFRQHCYLWAQKIWQIAQYLNPPVIFGFTWVDTKGAAIHNFHFYFYKC